MQDLDRSEEQQVSAASDRLCEDNSKSPETSRRLPQWHSKLKPQRYVYGFTKLFFFHLTDFLGLMLEQILGGKYPSDRYRNCVEGSYDGETYQFGLFDSFYRIHDDIVRHTRRCVR